MKKILFPLICSLSFILVSCSSDDDKVTLDKTTISFYADDTEQIVASENVEWSTDDAFIASVDNDGIVEGQHVGKTHIVASSKNGKARCEVEVKARYNTYTEPIFDFGSSRANIKNKETRNLESEDSSILSFLPSRSEPSINRIMYLFEDDEMTSAAAVVKLSSAMEATYFLLERYLVVSAGQQGYEGILINNLPAKATMAIGAVLENSYYLIIYTSYTLSRSESERKNYIEELTKKYVDLLRN